MFGPKGRLKWFKNFDPESRLKKGRLKKFSYKKGRLNKGQ